MRGTVKEARERVMGTPEHAAASSYAALVREVSGVMTNAEIAQACGVSPRQVQQWRAGRNHPRQAARRRLLDLVGVLQDLDEVLTPEGVEIVLHRRQRELGGRTPLELLAADEAEPVRLLAERLRAGAM